MNQCHTNSSFESLQMQLMNRLPHISEWKKRNIEARKLIRYIWLNNPEFLPQFKQFCHENMIELSIHNQQLLQFRLRQIEKISKNDRFRQPQFGGGKILEDTRIFLFHAVAKYQLIVQ